MTHQEITDRRLPAGRHGLSSEFVRASQQERMFDAMAHAVAEKGYGPVVVADVLSRAQVSRRTFYEHFAGKEECFLAAFDSIFGRFLAAAVEAYGAEEEWADRIRAGLTAMVGFAAADPAYGRMCLVEVLGAGREAVQRRDRAMTLLETFYDASRPEVPEHGQPPIVAEATVGGIYQLAYSRILRAGAEALPAALPDIVYVALLPFAGHAEAARQRDLARPAERAEAA